MKLDIKASFTRQKEVREATLYRICFGLSESIDKDTLITLDPSSIFVFRKKEQSALGC